MQSIKFPCLSQEQKNSSIYKYILKQQKNKAEAEKTWSKALHLIASLSWDVPVFCIHCLFAERIKLHTSSAQPDDRSSEDADSASLEILINKTGSKHHEITTADNTN